MKRKAILHGPSTLTVSLPSKWVKSHNIQKGDELNIDEEESGMLKISPGEEHLLTRKVKIDVSQLDSQSIRIIITVLHKSGYDEIEVKFKDPNTVKIIQERINTRLIGYEIIEQRGNTCIIRNVSGDHLSETDALIRRSFLVALSLANNSLKEIQKGRTDKLKELLVLEETNNKLVNYCQRLLNKKPYKDEKTIYKYVIIWLIESICDDYRDIIGTILERGTFRISDHVLKIYGEINELVNDYYALFYKYSNKDFMRIMRNVNSLKTKIEKTEFSSKEAHIRELLFSIINRIFDALGSTIGIHH